MFAQGSWQVGRRRTPQERARMFTPPMFKRVPPPLPFPSKVGPWEAQFAPPGFMPLGRGLHGFGDAEDTAITKAYNEAVQAANKAHKDAVGLAQKTHQTAVAAARKAKDKVAEQNANKAYNDALAQAKTTWDSALKVARETRDKAKSVNKSKDDAKRAALKAFNETTQMITKAYNTAHAQAVKAKDTQAQASLKTLHSSLDSSNKSKYDSIIKSIEAGQPLSYAAPLVDISSLTYTPTPGVVTPDQKKKIEEAKRSAQNAYNKTLAMIKDAYNKAIGDANKAKDIQAKSTINSIHGALNTSAKEKFNSLISSIEAGQTVSFDIPLVDISKLIYTPTTRVEDDKDRKKKAKEEAKVAYNDTVKMILNARTKAANEATNAKDTKAISVINSLTDSIKFENDKAYRAILASIDEGKTISFSAPLVDISRIVYVPTKKPEERPPEKEPPIETDKERKVKALERAKKAYEDTNLMLKQAHTNALARNKSIFQEAMKAVKPGGGRGANIRKVYNASVNVINKIYNDALAASKNIYNSIVATINRGETITFGAPIVPIPEFIMMVVPEIPAVPEPEPESPGIGPYPPPEPPSAPPPTAPPPTPPTVPPESPYAPVTPPVVPITREPGEPVIAPYITPPGEPAPTPYYPSVGIPPTPPSEVPTEITPPTTASFFDMLSAFDFKANWPILAIVGVGLLLVLKGGKGIEGTESKPRRKKK